MPDISLGSLLGQTPATLLTQMQSVDGPGSGLDSDLLDGKDSSAFALSGHTHAANTTAATDNTYANLPTGPSISTYTVAQGSPVDFSVLFTMNAVDNRVAQFAIGSQSDEFHWRGHRTANGGWRPWRRLWHDGNLVIANYAPLASPALTGTPVAPTATAGNASNQIATTQFVSTALSNLGSTMVDGTLSIAKTSGLQTALDGKLDKAGGSLTGALQINSGTGIQLAVGNWAQLSSGGNGNLVLGNNVYYQNADNTYRYAQTHASLGGSGIVMTGFNGGTGPYYFDQGDVATTAGAAFTPTLQQMWHAGNFTPSSKADATNPNTTGLHQHFSTGAVGTQVILRALGWNNSVARWKEVLETDATWSLYGYDTAGGTPTRIFNTGTAVSGGSQFLTLSGDLTIANAQSLFFGSGSTRQMVNLWSTNYGLGIQNNTMYFRTGSPVGRHVGGYAWFRAGVHDVNVYNPGTGGTLLANLDGDGNFRASGELVSTASNGLRIVSGNYGTFFRNDGASLYMLITASGDQYGTWNSLRPFTVALGSGTVTMGHGLSVTGAVSATGEVSGNRFSAGWDAGIAGSVCATSWFRSSGNTGWHNNDYNGGIYMIDATYLRSYNGKAIAASDFVLTSDKRLKTNIRPFEFRGRLRPVNFTMIESGQDDIGFIADDVKKLYPEAVGEMKKDGGLLDGKKIKQLSQPKLTAVISYQVNRAEDNIIKLEKSNAKLVKENGKLKTETKSLKERLARLEKQVAKLVA